MSDLTKQALVSSFKKLLETEPFDKITIADITNDCNLSRQTFYYHFRDIFDMIRWIYNADAASDSRNRTGYGTWQEKLRQVFDYTKANKDLIIGTYNSKCRNDLIGYYMDVSVRRIADVIDMKAGGDISEKDKKFIASAFAYSFVGTVVDWISSGMEEGVDDLMDRITIYLEATFDNTLRTFSLHRRRDSKEP